MANQSLRAIVTTAAVSSEWRRLKKSHRAVRPTDVRLINDPLNHLPFELYAAAQLSALGERVTAGRYAANAPVVVRIAKRNALRRPIVYAMLEDVLLLGTLIEASQPELDEILPEWASFGGKRTRGSAGKQDPYETWFEAFLRFHARADKILKNSDTFIVTADIANFFPSINLQLLRERYRERVSVDPSVTALLFRLLNDLGGAVAYDPHALRGLPQEPDDYSRVLANFLLADVDEALAVHGKSGRFARFADDMIVSAASVAEARSIVMTLQEVLERLGLSLNSSKTRVWNKSDWQASHFPDRNEYLDSLNGYDALPAPELARLDREIREFVRLPSSGEYDRLLRRYYNSARRFGSDALVRRAWNHIESFPDSARYMLEYMQTVRPTFATANRFVAFATAGSPGYEDLQIQAYEALLHIPLPRSPIEQKKIVEQIKSHLTEITSAGFAASTSGYVASLALLTLYRFGGSSALPELSTLAGRTDCPLDLARQLYVFHRTLGNGGAVTDEFPARFADPGMLQAQRFFDDIEARPAAMLRRARAWLMPAKSTWPERRLLRARALPVWAMFARLCGSSKEFSGLMRATEKEIESLPSALQDRMGRTLIKSTIP